MRKPTVRELCKADDAAYKARQELLTIIKTASFDVGDIMAACREFVSLDKKYDAMWDRCTERTIKAYLRKL